MAYDQNNVFARILRGELPAQKVYEDDHVLAFNDIAPKAPTHVLVIPKQPYVSMDDFTRDAGAEEVGRYFKMVGEIARKLGLAENGYRLILNIGGHGGQEVPHIHVHILGGRPIGPMVVQR
ncbi:MAG: histidine triad nucleotide-binding protein [Alphaproteobacteria bacterium]